MRAAEECSGHFFAVFLACREQSKASPAEKIGLCVFCIGRFVFRGSGPGRRPAPQAKTAVDCQPGGERAAVLQVQRHEPREVLGASIIPDTHLTAGLLLARRLG